jgi:hypothetical protein
MSCIAHSAYYQALGVEAVGKVIAMVNGKNYGTYKQELIVEFHPRFVPLPPSREVSKSETPSPLMVAGVLHKGPAVFLHAQHRLRRHPLFGSGPGQRHKALRQPLEKTAEFLKKQPQCKGIPIFVTMASVGSSKLYAQLVENFVYSMVRFGYSDCSLVVCMSDPGCMKLCDDYNFPCYDWNFAEHYPSRKTEIVHKMEEIAVFKLRHIPLALQRGVDLFILDLDVGFLSSPAPILDIFNDPRNAATDCFVQQDLIFIMNRTRIGWKTWFTEPLPNIGMFLVRGNKRTLGIFQHSWRTYNKYTLASTRSQPGKDQNNVLGAMRYGRAWNALKYAFLPNNTWVLLDKIYTWQHNRSVELGGGVSEYILGEQRVLAVHSTCYERGHKMWGLRVANAYWNPRYYVGKRRTLAKLIFFTDNEQVLDVFVFFLFSFSLLSFFSLLISLRCPTLVTRVYSSPFTGAI